MEIGERETEEKVKWMGLLCENRRERRKRMEKGWGNLSGGGWCRRAEASSVSCPFVFVRV